MSSAGPAPAPRPSVFLSYASDDRVAARALRDALGAAGLEVWYDENELGGGDAWDQKIRRQIRDCDYFLPVISAATERRKEGYFRREWRLAAERTMDMADDVLFLLPVVIDGTTESNARVPEKFLAVQWLRAPDGTFTPALEALTQRLLAGEHSVAPRPPLLARPGATAPAAPAPPEPAAARPAHPPPPAMPPMPPFPPHPAGSGHWPRYCAEIFWWMLTAAWLLFSRLPRWVRILLAVWLVITLLGPCSRSSRAPRPEKPAADLASAEIKDALNSVAKETTAALKDAKKQSGAEPDLARIGAELVRRFAGQAGLAAASGKALVVAPFPDDPQNPAGARFAQAAFGACYAQLATRRPGSIVISPLPPTAGDDAALAALGRDLRAAFMLGAQISPPPAGPATLRVRLLRVSDGHVAWSGDFPVVEGEAANTGARIADAVGALLP